MGAERFTPSVDWNNELVTSLLWVLTAFVVTALLLALALLLVARYTEWGRQFCRITGGYFTGRASIPVWATLAALLTSAIVSVRISVLLSYYANDLFSSLQLAFEGQDSSGGTKDSGISGFWASMAIFAILAIAAAVRFLLDLYLTQRFILRWRVWLSRNMISDWIVGRAYYRGQLAKNPVDNPDQRIQQDIDIVTTVMGEPNTPSRGSGSTMLFGAVESLLSVAAFGVILWQLSGPLTFVGMTLPKALFWIVIGYVLVATVIAFWIGRPLIRLSYLNEVRNASFRYSMIRMKDAASAIGLYRGEDVEQAQLHRRLTLVVANYRRWLHRMMLFIGWNLSASQAINPLPYIVQAQRLFADEITFGGVMQSATAFHAIHDALSFFRNAYDSFASYRAALLRLDGLIDANRRARLMPGLRIEDTQGDMDDVVALENVDVRTPDGQRLIAALDVRLKAGESLVITGPSGTGKTTLLNSVAGLWPYASGNVRYPTAARETMFVSQLPYLPLGDLKTVVCYPSFQDAVTDADVQRALRDVALPHLIIRIHEVKDWALVLSVGEQQRIAFARVLLNRPRAVFLDESTSALDEGLELMLYQLLRAALPRSIVVSVSHRDTVEQHHDRQLTLLGGGRWQLDRVAAPSPPVQS